MNRDAKATVVKVSTTKPIMPLEVKRFYLPGVVVEATCPHCGKVVVQDYSREYLGYPTANDPFKETFGHSVDGPGPDHEFVVELVLRLSLEVVP